MSIYSRELLEHPPADALIQLYFEVNKWWSPPDLRAPTDAAEGEPEIWEAPLPAVTE